MRRVRTRAEGAGAPPRRSRRPPRKGPRRQRKGPGCPQLTLPDLATTLVTRRTRVWPLYVDGAFSRLLYLHTGVGRARWLKQGPLALPVAIPGMPPPPLPSPHAGQSSWPHACQRGGLPPLLHPAQLCTLTSGC